MDFSLFAHMERMSADQPHQELYEDFVSLCQMADDGGMRAIWTGEHHGMEFTIAPNPFLSITDLAHRTKNVKLGTGYDRGALLAPDQAGGRGGGHGPDDRRAAGTGDRARGLFL